ncbi:E3 ubiquitin-protein ligase rififylin isoform X2 [Xenopus laevis]|nr:E3 ubiquitin-protein ligase rififylin isoform X2 [Xenopus laevis]XP_018100673.1 E3 ubiquitin-protein ligase rififylin isoform X2 [Xenopus laevis]XP_041438184.1 E3 ubiquitin-protein ligase rififylin isoform X2 [Xenopus laevis]AAH80063.1 MGC84042 protein [Xenopus laevis]
MWAACCNWLCFDTEPQEISQGDRTQAFSNSNFRTAPPVSEISCKACGIRFAACARKNPCMDCKNYYCTACLIQANNGHSLCQVCRSIRSTAFDRVELMKLRVKDLRDYLTLKDIPIDLCREKEDLVQLILFHKPPVFSADGTNVPTSTSDQSTANQRTDSSYTPGHPPSNTSAANRNGSSNAQGTAEEHLVDSDSSDPEENLAPGRRASLSDLTCVDDIEALSVRQLKEILARNFVDYKGCCEKWELMERVTRLYNEQKGLQQKAAEAEAEGIPGTASDENICKVCMDCPIDCVLLECGHMVTCTKCGKRMSECPICRQYVVRAVHVFRS